MASGQVSMMLGAKGPNFSTVSACATGVDSIGEAYEMIREELLMLLYLEVPKPQYAQ